jgi:hypothetical protein
MAELMRRKGAIFLAIIILSAAIVAFEFTSPNSSGNQDKPLVHNGMDEPVYEIPSGHTSLGTECQAGDLCALQDMLPILISSLFNPDQELGTGPSPDNGNVSSGTSLGLQIPQQIEIVAEVEVRGTVLSINPQLLRLIVRVEPLQAANKAIITMDSQWLAIDATGAGEGWICDRYESSGNRSSGREHLPRRRKYQTIQHDPISHSIVDLLPGACRRGARGRNGLFLAYPDIFN